MLLEKIHYKDKSRIILIVLFFLFTQECFRAQDIVVSRGVVLMGSQFNITVVDKDSISAHQNITEVINEIDRIENLISEWRPHTQISQVNQNAGIKPVKVDSEVFDLTKRAIQYSRLSDGAFDVSIVAMDKIWKFDDSMQSLPSDEELQISIRNVGFNNIVLDSIQSTIFLSKKGMKIGFGSIGKGYAADRGRTVLMNKKIKGGIIDASGDIATWGTPVQEEFWKIGVKNPFKRNKLVSVLKLNNSAVATSGSYEKYAEINGNRYSHIINPKTGMPATGLTSVSVIGSSTEFANFLSTSIMVLGYKKGKLLMRKFPEYRSIVITDKGRIKKM